MPRSVSRTHGYLLLDYSPNHQHGLLGLGNQGKSFPTACHHVGAKKMGALLSFWREIFTHGSRANGVLADVLERFENPDEKDPTPTPDLFWIRSATASRTSSPWQTFSHVETGSVCFFVRYRMLSISQLRSCRTRITIWNRHLLCWQSTTTTRCSSNSRIAAHTPVAEVHVPENASPADLADMIRLHFTNKAPLVLRRACHSMPAVQKWSDLAELQERLLQESASTMGAVEIGGSYSSSQTERAEIPIPDYMQYLQLFQERHGRQGSDDPWERPTDISSDELVYMAQNDLPQSLYKDITIPDFCQEEIYGIGLGRLYSVMWWLGPRACVSPLHFDPLDNILMQFVGRKVFWLFDPHHGDKSMWHYAGHNGQQSNTSPVNPEHFDRTKFPRFEHEGPPAQRCVLQPDDMIYIPCKWWHFVRSVDTSVSVNVWWR